MTGQDRIRVALLAMVLGLGACEPRDVTVPTDQQVATRFIATQGVSVEMKGNVAEITVVQPYAQVRRGGALWAKVGPYVYLFSEETRSLFTDYDGLAGVRVITATNSQGEIARAMITRDAMSDVLWRRSLNIAGQARLDGTQRPSLLEDLVRWGEDHTEHNYNPRFAR